MATVTATPMTMTQKIIAIAVTIIIISTVAIPVIGDLQNQQTTEINNSTQNYVSTTTGTASVTMTWNTGTLTVNGVVVEHGNYTVIAAGLNCILYVEANTAATMVYVDASNPTVLNRIKSLTWDAGSITTIGSDGTTETTYPDVGNIYYINKTGDIGMFVNGTEAHIDYGQTALYVSLRTGGYIGTNTIIDGEITAAGIPFKGIISGAVVNPTSFSITPNVTEDESGLSYTISTVSVSYTYNSSNYGPWTNGVIFAPLKYHTISNDDQRMINLLGIIPVILILVPVMMAVRMMALRRN